MSEKEYRLRFLQQILQGKKKCLLQRDVPSRTVPSWPELSVKNVYPQVREQCPEIMAYLPDPEDSASRLPPRDFFFAVLSALKPQEVDDMVNKAAAVRQPQKENLQEQRWGLAITDEWMDRLLQFDYVSSKCLTTTTHLI